MGIMLKRLLSQYDETTFTWNSNKKIDTVFVCPPSGARTIADFGKVKNQHNLKSCFKNVSTILSEIPFLSLYGLFSTFNEK